MTDTPIAILQKAADLGLTLSFTPPDTLDVKASGPWPKSFADTLRTHKSQLLACSSLPFVMVFSKILEETVFFCEDEATKARWSKPGLMSGASTQRTSCARSGAKPRRAAFSRRTTQSP